MDIQLKIDGQKVRVPGGATVMEAAGKLGVYIPHFCYHNKLSIAANCRMCLVQVEKTPKPMPACATPALERHGGAYGFGGGPKSSAIGHGIFAD